MIGSLRTTFARLTSERFGQCLCGGPRVALKVGGASPKCKSQQQQHKQKHCRPAQRWHERLRDCDKRQPNHQDDGQLQRHDQQTTRRRGEVKLFASAGRKRPARQLKAQKSRHPHQADPERRRKHSRPGDHCDSCPPLRHAKIILHKVSNALHFDGCSDNDRRHEDGVDDQPANRTAGCGQSARRPSPNAIAPTKSAYKARESLQRLAAISCRPKPPSVPRRGSTKE